MTEYTLRERWLGTALQLRRERAGMTQKEAAARLKYNVQKLSRIENGQLPDVHALRAMLDMYGVLWDEEAPYLELYERAAAKGWWRAQTDDRTGGFISLEHDATKVWNYQAKLIPGLFQLESYTRRLFELRASARSSKWIEHQTQIRGRRRERLFGDDPLEFHSVIEEQVFRFADSDQLMFISELGALPNVTVQVIEDTLSPHDGDSGTFTLLEFPYPNYPKVLYVEHVAGVVVVEDPADVSAATASFEQVSGLALSPDQSAEWIGKLAAERQANTGVATERHDSGRIGQN